MEIELQYPADCERGMKWPAICPKDPFRTLRRKKILYMQTEESVV